MTVTTELHHDRVTSSAVMLATAFTEGFLRRSGALLDTVTTTAPQCPLASDIIIEPIESGANLDPYTFIAAREMGVFPPRGAVMAKAPALRALIAALEAGKVGAAIAILEVIK